MKIAILGYGTVGSGVYRILQDNGSVVSGKAGEDISVKYVLDIRDFPGDPVQDKLVKDFQTILSDDEIETVVETMGGEEPAYSFVKQSLMAGKNVVTSNKVLVAAHGPELCGIATEKIINFFFEASVGGGIPVIRPLLECITADNISGISGILNGTTNYMLSRMKDEEISYEEALKSAQEKGYAEKDPSADVEGHDACRKIAILASLVCGQQVNFEDIFTEGIGSVSQKDFEYAKLLGADIKLLASARFSGKGISALVAPALVGSGDPLFSVNDVFNAVKIEGDMLGDVMFYGKGAGSLPTASAVASDVVQSARCRGRNIPVSLKMPPAALLPIEEYESRFLLRIDGREERFESEFLSLFPDAELISTSYSDGEFAVLTGVLSLGELEKKIAGVKGIISWMFVSGQPV